MTTCRDDEILLAVRTEEGHGHGACTGGQISAPELAAGGEIESIDGGVQSSRDEDDATGSDDGTTQGHGAPGGRSGRLLSIASRDAAKWNLPLFLTGTCVDRQQSAPGRRGAGKPLRADQNAPHHAVGRAVLGSEFPIAIQFAAARAFDALVVAARDQLDLCGEVVLGKDEEAAGRIVGHAAPILAAGVPGKLQRSGERRRSKYWAGVEAADFVAAPFSVSFISPPGVVNGHVLRRDRRGKKREGLSGRSSFTGNVAFRYRAFFDTENRLTSRAIEDEEMARFGADGDGRDGDAILVEVKEQGRRGHVVVPEVVVNGLEGPHALTRFGAQSDDGIGIAIVAGTFTAEVVGTRAAGGNKDEIADWISGDNGPGIGGAGTRSMTLPGSEGRIGWISRDGVPGPFELAGKNVEAAHFTAGLIGRAVIRDAGTNDDGVANNCGWRSLLVVSVAVRREAQAVTKIDHAIIAKVRARPAGGRVERDEMGIDSGDEDTTTAAGEREAKVETPRFV